MSISATLFGLAEPVMLLLLAGSFLPKVIFNLIRTANYAAFTDWDTFSSEWFATTWKVAGPMVRQGAEANVVPLLQGRVRAGAVVPAADATHPGVGGTVVEIGPGSGMWVSIFSDKYVTDTTVDAKDASSSERKIGQRTRVDKAYGIEPNPGHHPALAGHVKEAGLDGRYEIVPMGIQDIAGRHIAKGSLDAIVTILCLCSIPDPRENVAELYQYLKPGGTWYVYEHVKAYPKQGEGLNLYQREWKKGRRGAGEGMSNSSSILP